MSLGLLKTEWVAPVVLAQMKDWSLWFGIDYRTISQCNHKRIIRSTEDGPVYRFPRWRDDIFYCSCQQYLITEENVWRRRKAVFISHHRLCKFVKMLFSLQNMAGTLQRRKDIILLPVNWQFAQVYLENIGIFPLSPEQHIVQIIVVLSLLKQAGVTFNLKKWKLFTDNIHYLRHIWLCEKAPETTYEIKILKYPTNVIKLKSFFDLCNVYRRFFLDFSRITALQNKFMRKGELRIWTERTVDAVREDLKQKCVSTPAQHCRKEMTKWRWITSKIRILIVHWCEIKQLDGRKR